MKLTLKNGESVNLPRGFDVILNADGPGFYITFNDHTRYVNESSSFESLKIIIVDILTKQLRTTNRIIAYLLSQ